MTYLILLSQTTKVGSRISSHIAFLVLSANLTQSHQFVCGMSLDLSCFYRIAIPDPEHFLDMGCQVAIFSKS